jgi:uncharacterized protein (TIGR03000 family)
MAPMKTVPMDAPSAPMSDPPAAPPAETETSTGRADGLLAVNVPEDAKIYVNGQPTRSTGGRREFVSRGLELGSSYTYEVRAEMIRDGQTVTETKTVDLRGGETARLAFALAPTEKVETKLTVRVPADAKVYLAGNETSAKGETRVFRTTGLRNGKAWEDYLIKVELDRGGRTVIQEKRISLRAGETKELEFDFDQDKVADAR